MDCQRFATQMKYIKHMADTAVEAIQGGDSNKANEALESLERVLGLARINLNDKTRPPVRDGVGGHERSE